MIEESQTRANNGAGVAGEVESVLREVITAVAKVGDLLTEVSASSKEQAQGVEQVNAAIAQLDQVTQSNAASAEENAASGQELSSQAAGLDTLVNEMAIIVGLEVAAGKEIGKASRSGDLGSPESEEGNGAAFIIEI